MPREDYTHKMVNGERVELTEAEIDEYVAREDAWEAGATDRAWAAIRRERDMRIAETDFYALSDVTMSDDMKSYRESLRQIPQTTSDPVAFETQWYDFQSEKSGVSDPWPTKP